MPRLNKSQIYARVKRKLWRNEKFRYDLSDDARLLWLYLMTTFREARLPGLVEATVLTIMEDLGWHERGLPDSAEEHEGIIFGSKRTSAALTEVTEQGWVLYSKTDRLMLLLRGVDHNLPANEDVVVKWTKTLDEYPDTETKRLWVKNAVTSLRRAYGKNDARYKRLHSYWSALCQPPLDDSKDAVNTMESDSGCTPCHTPCEPDVQGKTPNRPRRRHMVSSPLSLTLELSLTLNTILGEEAMFRHLLRRRRNPLRGQQRLKNRKIPPETFQIDR